MSNPSPTIREDLQAIAAQLLTYAKPHGGTVKIMANMRHLWEEIYNGGVVDENPRILICWTGEKARGEYEGGEKTKLHRVDRMWTVVVMRGHGFTNGMTEIKGQPNTPGYYEDFADSIETVRDGVRVMSHLSQEDVVNYIGCEPLPNVAQGNVANIFMDCMQLRFSTAADIPEILINGTTG